jgi:hypothetical protein
VTGEIVMLTSWCRFFGYGMVAVGLTFVPVATMTYVSDCYLPVNADALLLVNGLKVHCPEYLYCQMQNVC